MRSVFVPALLSGLLLAVPATALTAGSTVPAAADSEAKVVYVKPDSEASTTKRLLVAGAGAGVGFLVTNYLLANAIVPLAHTIMGGLGWSPATAHTVASSVTAIGLVWGTYKGSLYARDLIIN